MNMRIESEIYVYGNTIDDLVNTAQRDARAVASNNFGFQITDIFVESVPGQTYADQSLLQGRVLVSYNYDLV